VTLTKDERTRFILMVGWLIVGLVILGILTAGQEDSAPTRSECRTFSDGSQLCGQTVVDRDGNQFEYRGERPRPGGGREGVFQPR